ncbi:MAG TPA: four helix bundle protein [Thermoanaerobaculia bacterium]|nr:four helix bundle protein [Thermoanaerobaculia bacterium]
MSDYHQLEVWQKARKLSVHVYRRAARLPSSARVLVDQMQRAALSVASNVAEAQGRQTSRERIRFFGIARGSLIELEMQTLISGDLGYFSPRQTEIIINATNELARQMNALIRHYKTRPS